MYSDGYATVCRTDEWIGMIAVCAIDKLESVEPVAPCPRNEEQEPVLKYMLVHSKD